MRGKKTVHHIVERLSGDYGVDSRMLRQWGIHITPGANCNISNVAFQKNIEAPNRFILCFSNKLAHHTMQQFDGANSCIEIISKPDFFLAVTTALNAITPVNFLGIHEVQYRPRVEIWNGTDFGIDPSLVKENKFSLQHELRAVWEPKFGQPIHPLIIGDHRLGQFIKFVLPSD